MDKEPPSEPLEVIYKFWKEHFTFTYKGEQTHLGWVILFVGILLLLGYLGSSVPYDYR